MAEGDIKRSVSATNSFNYTPQTVLDKIVTGPSSESSEHAQRELQWVATNSTNAAFSNGLKNYVLPQNNGVVTKEDMVKALIDAGNQAKNISVSKEAQASAARTLENLGVADPNGSGAKGLAVASLIIANAEQLENNKPNPGPATRPIPTQS